MKLWSLIILLLMSFVLKAADNEISFGQLNAKDGLFGSRIFSTFRASDGALWIAGIEGVARFDGRNITNYSSTDSSSEHFISGSRFFQITEDKYRTIWVSCDRGVRYLPYGEKRFLKLDTEMNRSVKYLHLMNDSTLLVSYNGKKTYLIDVVSHQKQQLSIDEFVVGVVTDVKGSILKGTSDGSVFNTANEAVITVTHGIKALQRWRNNQLWIVTENEILLFDLNHKGRQSERDALVTYPHNFVNNFIRSFACQDNILWIGTDHGLIRRELDDQYKIIDETIYYGSLDIPLSLLNNQINDIYIDHEDIVWISTYGGLNKIDPAIPCINHLQHDAGNYNSLHDNNIFPIDGDCKGKVWFGSYRHGIAQYDVDKRMFRRFNNPGSSIKAPYIGYIYHDTDGVTWVCASNSLYRYAGKEFEKVDVLDRNGKLIVDKKISSIIHHPQSGYWVSVGEQLINGNYQSGRMVPTGQRNIRTGSVIRSYIDTENRLWFGSFLGLFMLDPQTNYGKAHFCGENQPIIKDDNVGAIMNDSEGNLWFGSRNGLYRIDREDLKQPYNENVKIHGYFRDNGLTNNYITGILPEKDGRLWISSWNGILSYNPKDENIAQFTPYSFNDGLKSDKFNRNAMFLDTLSHTYYFGGVNGVCYFTPKRIASSVKGDPKVMIHDITVDGDKLQASIAADSGCAEVICDHKPLVMTMRLASTSLLAPTKQVFAWRYSKEEEWQYSRTGILELKDLDTGDNQLQLCVIIGGKRGAVSTLNVKVGSPLKAYVLGLVILLVLGGAIVILLRRRKEGEKVGEKYMFSKMSDARVKELIKELQRAMINDKAFLNPQLTATQLANQMGATQVELSQLLNDVLQTKFYEYVNKHRVDEFVARLDSPEASNYTLTGLAEQCGFQSKSTFYRVFNAEKGMTPAQYAKAHQSKNR
ncbi:helix-turn-helix domain-containing protein [Puteibacter caeruleilacunae]|nr:helix-turn-helix domain-containing protein [Puteibacter caeruleilacunae]